MHKLRKKDNAIEVDVDGKLKCTLTFLHYLLWEYMICHLSVRDSPGFADLVLYPHLLFAPDCCTHDKLSKEC